jgi:hypothetical protein
MFIKRISNVETRKITATYENFDFYSYEKSESESGKKILDPNPNLKKMSSDPKH